MKIEIVSYKVNWVSGKATIKKVPNRIGRIFGRKEKIIDLIWEGTTYRWGGGRKWFNKATGEVYGEVPELDTRIRKDSFNM